MILEYHNANIDLSMQHKATPSHNKSINFGYNKPALLFALSGR
jgi:hypothetical protein